MQTADVIDLARSLISIDSVNPTLATGGAGEHEIARFIEAWAARNGLASRIVRSPDGRPNVLVSDEAGIEETTGAGARAGGPALMLYGHMDTVGLGTMAGPLEARIEGDRLLGRGAYDQKAGLAAALIAAREAIRSGVRGPVVAVAVADEEAESNGIQAVLRNFHADAAIVTEPTEMAVGIAHRGFVWMEIEVLGRAAHGSRPQLGVDAIFRAGPVVVALERYDRKLAEHVHPLLGSGLLHASLIQGGREMSIIPDRCLLSVERRTLPGEPTGAVLAEIEAVLESCRAADPALVASARVTLARDPFEIPADHPLAELARSAIGRVTGSVPATTGVSYWADAAFIAAAGIPAILVGPPGEGAHAEVEWASVSGTLTCARALTEIALDFCR